MSRVLLDTCAYSALDRGHAGISRAVQTATEVIFTPIVLGELRAGFRGGTRERMNEGKLKQFLLGARCSVVPLDHETSVFYAEIKHYLDRQGNRIPINDVCIAATAMQHGLKLVTTDRHFLEVPQVLVDFHEPLQ